LQISPRQLASRLFTRLAVAWISWIYDFKLLKIDFDNFYLVFSCKKLGSDGKCGDYAWRPNICRNYPLVDYFEEPKFLPGCGFKASLDG
jgi:Fe-S-cluster containining protein